MPSTSQPSLFAERLQSHRIKSDLSQEGLADKILVGKSSVQRWEAGETFPDVRELLRLCDLFKVTPNYLTGYSDTPLGLWPDQYLIDEQLADEMRADPQLKGTVLWKVPRRLGVLDKMEDVLRVRAELGLERTQ